MTNEESDHDLPAQQRNSFEKYSPKKTEGPVNEAFISLQPA